MNICLTIDNHYERMARACVHEIIKHAHPDTFLTFYIIAHNLADPNIFYKFERYDNVRVWVSCINPYDYFNLDKYFKLKYHTAMMYVKCLLPRYGLVPERGRTLYIDPDVFTFKDLNELYTTDLHGNLIGAIKDSNSILTGTPEFSSGIMLMSADELNKFNFTEKCLERITGEIPDRPIINEVLKDHVQYLPLKYGFSYNRVLQYPNKYGDISVWNNAYGANYQSIEDLKNDTVLMHFNGYKKEQMQNSVIRGMYDRAFYLADEFLRQ